MKRYFPTQIPLFRLLRVLFFGAVCGAILNCASAHNKPLVSRGLPADERRDFTLQNGYNVPPNIRDAFIAGYVVPGMSKELVFQLYGAPDRASGRDSKWEYVNETGQLITGITFKDDKVDSIYGDPNGGIRAPRPAGIP